VTIVHSAKGLKSHFQDDFKNCEAREKGLLDELSRNGINSIDSIKVFQNLLQG